MNRSGPPKRRASLQAQSPRLRRVKPLRARRATPSIDWKDEADRLFSLLVRHRARGQCEKCGAQRRLECAHIIPRRNAATRTDLDNAWGLCRTCHNLVDSDPDEKRQLAAATIGAGVYGLLLSKARHGVKADTTYWRSEYERLVEHGRTVGLS